jgi:hypothetical protein
MPIDGLACPKKTNEGDAQPEADNCVIDSQSQHSAASHTPGAGIWTSEALPAPSSRHMSGEAWPREHMHVAYERRGTELQGCMLQMTSQAVHYVIHCRPFP